MCFYLYANFRFFFQKNINFKETVIFLFYFLKVIFYLLSALYKIAERRNSLSCSSTKIKSLKLTLFIFGLKTLKNGQRIKYILI